MRIKFKKGEKVIVCGSCKDDGTFYSDINAEIVECDPYYKDYLVRFEDNTEAWFLKEYIKKIESEINKPKRRKRRKRKKTKKRS